jgi:uncharacterized Zn finger protein
VPVAVRRRNGALLALESRRRGSELQPVEITAGGRAIASTFWGSAWCENLERYSDFSNRLPRGRTYVRNGSVIDLRIEAGQVRALVSGSDVYTVTVRIDPLAKAHWKRLCVECSGGIDSLVELLQGHFSKGVMAVLCRPGTGMFPEPRQIAMSCSCPDWATMCKHVAAVLYGVGARLDEEPGLLFTLRQVDQAEMISSSAGGIDVAAPTSADEALAGADLGALFGIELDERPPAAAARTPRDQPARRERRAKRSPARRATVAPVLEPWIDAAELRQRGVPQHVVQSWLRKGLLEHSGTRGIYVRTTVSEDLVRQHLASRRRRRRRA